ncbi:MAG: histidine phosphatase family protein [Firmicutes bacterium]|nr:histidine phosphatase family protein [Bacillota bacterium]
MNIGYTRAADPSRYGAVILAAGYSSRMNDFKPLLPVDGRPALTGLAEMLHSAGIRDIVIVTGHQREKLQEEIERLHLTESYNEDFAQGMFSSIQAGLAKAGQAFPDKRGYFLVPVDCPLITIRAIRELMTAADADAPAAGNADAADAPEAACRFFVPTFEGKKGHPLLVPAGRIQEILSYDGDGGLKAITDKAWDQMVRVPVPDEEILLDMDTPEHYEEIQRFVAHGFKREKLEVLSSMKRILLVRHGETQQHEEPMFIGQYDVPLSDEGRERAKALGEQLAELIEPDVAAEKNYIPGVSLGREPLPAIERIYCSDLSRAVETAEIIAECINEAYRRDRIYVEVQPLQGLREIDLGPWDGRPIREIRETEPEAYERRGRDLFTFKTGNHSENFYDMQYRTVAALRDILEDDYARNVIIVTHSGVIRALENNLRGLRVDDDWEPVGKGQYRIWTE